MTERLDKIISSRSSLSRSDVRDAIRSGAVCVDGKVVLDPSFKADTQINSLTLNGRPFLNDRHIYIMMNKPKGVVSASEDGADTTVVELVPESLRRDGLFPAGRLDKDTTGFVLITDDGDFAHRMLSPRSHVPKTYEATLERPALPSYIDAFRTGVVLGDGTQCLSGELELLGECHARVRIHEGRYHQIKRMFAALGNSVVDLTRTHIGAVPLDTSLSGGECRSMTDDEIRRIFE